MVAGSGRTSIRTTSSCCRREADGAGASVASRGRVGATTCRSRCLPAFVPRQEWLLEPGDMLYLPPGWGHEGTAVGACITCSIGFRAPRSLGLAAETLQRLGEAAAEEGETGNFGKLYADAGQPPTTNPARIPAALQHFADAAIEAALRAPRDRHRALGEVMSEPKPGTWFERVEAASPAGDVVLDRRTRMLYDDDHIFINGEAFRAGGSDAKLMRRLADERHLSDADGRRLGADARQLLARWVEAGWCKNRRSDA